MNTSTEITELKKLSPCSEGLDWAVKQKSLADAWETCERGDWMIWYLKRRSLLTKEQSVNIAIQCAERVISIFEKKCPSDNRPRKAIEAAKAWLADPSDDNKKKAAAATAAAATAAAATAAAATAAAYAAAATAAAAAYAAATTTYAAAAAYAAATTTYAAAAAYARASERKAQAVIIRAIVNNPFVK